MHADPSQPATQFLHAQPWFAELPALLRQRVLDESLTLSAAKGQVILAAGAPVQGWYAVLSGLVKLESSSADGKRSAYMGMPEGEWFGEGSALKAEPRRYDVIALRDSQLLCLPRPVFDTLRTSSLAFNQHLVQHLNLRLGQAMAIIEAGRIRSPEQRVALCLSRLFWRGTRRISLSQEELGHLAGLSRQTVNRVLGVLAQQGLVALDFNRVTIPDDQALNAYLATPQGVAAPPPRRGRRAATIGA